MATHIIKKVTIAGAQMALVYDEDASGDISANLLNETYAPNELLVSKIAASSGAYDTWDTVDNGDKHTQTLVWNGTALSASFVKAPSPSTTISGKPFFVLDVIGVAYGATTSTFGVDGRADYFTWNGNKITLRTFTLDSVNYYCLHTVFASGTGEPKKDGDFHQIPIFRGMPIAGGQDNELLVNTIIDGATKDISDIENNADGNKDIRFVVVGGVPLAAGRIGGKYYLIVPLHAINT